MDHVNEMNPLSALSSMSGENPYILAGLQWYNQNPLFNFNISGATPSTNFVSFMDKRTEEIQKSCPCPAPEVDEVEEEEYDFVAFLGDLGNGAIAIGKGALTVGKGVADFIILDDINTLMDPNASGFDKGIAVASFIPIGKVLKGGKMIGKIIDSDVDDVVKKSNVDDVVDKGKPTKAETLQKNREKGKAFEQAQLIEFEKTADNVVEQVTINTNQGTKIRVDAIGTDKTTGDILIQEYKSSTTAPLTKNQTKGFPELQSGGGTVVGKGKGIFEGGTQIPPTKVEIIRPE